MNTFWGHFAGVVTLILMLTFITIWIWAWRPRHKPLFDRMAELPMRETEQPDQRGGEGHRS